jgi:hypothetical protein
MRLFSDTVSSVAHVSLSESSLFRDIEACVPLKVGQCFGVIYHPHLQDRTVNQKLLITHAAFVIRLFFALGDGPAFSRNIDWLSTIKPITMMLIIF